VPFSTREEPVMAPRAMEPKDITRIVWVSDPQISPDGARVAFVATTLSEERDEYLSNIWIVDAAGGPARRFTAGPKRDRDPRWSPDGTRLAFVSEREGKKKGQLYVMPADGGEPTRLTDERHGVGDPVWSPDGSRIAFVARVGGWQEPEREEDRKSRPARVITTLKYRWNGEGFTYDRRRHVFVVPAAGGAPRQITDGDWDDADPAWSPDARHVAFSSARHLDRDLDDSSDLWLVGAEGGEPRRLTDTLGPAFLPAFSPDGRSIAYLGRRSKNEYGKNVRVFALPLGGGEPRCLTSDLDRSCASLHVRPIWTPDGAAITFAAEDRGALGVFRAETSGRAARRVVDGDRVVTGYSVSADGRRIAFAATGPLTPAEVFVAGAAGGDERALTDLNQAWRAEVALSSPERHQVERDGFAIDVWVMKPHGFRADATFPVLLNIHGGPHAQYGHGFFDEFQVYAGAGYGVIYANPRGSQGYGEAFTRAVVGDWGGGDYADVMAALDQALARHPWMDRGRLGVMGGSYGGFLTSWIVGHTDRFKAACSERAVNDQYGMFGNSDIGHLFNVLELGGAVPWENMAEYLARSPVTYAKDVTTPLLIVHSEDDLRCPIEQAEQLFVALAKLGKDVMFVRFPDENHELSRTGTPRHRLERFRFILDWFARHLAAPAAGRAT
jgi:dipeptidyl aminopeptidase/acylaminoacyl peptidase